VGFGLQTAVTPDGRPESERVTLPENPYCPKIATYDWAVSPWPILTLPGLDSVKVGVNTPSITVMVEVKLPDVPVTVKFAVPKLADGLAVSVNVVLEFDDVGENDAVTPVGSPDTEKFTLPLNP
jgi:hypothetical protein